MKNLQPVYYTYISGVINDWHPTLEEATKKAAERDNGIEFNGSWLQAKTGVYEAGTLELNGDTVIEQHWKTHTYESVAHVSQLPWVKWGNLATARP